MTAFVTMVILPSFLLALSTSSSGSQAHATDFCFRYDADGCSIPFNMYFFFKKCFTPSCNRHDICYSCGVGYDVTRATCDRSFRHDMVNTCRRNFMHSSSPTDTQISEDDIQTLQRKTNVLSILDKHAGQFQSIFEKLIPHYIHLSDKLDLYRGTYEFTQRYADHVVTRWAGLLEHYLHVKDNSDRLLPNSGQDHFKKGYVEFITDGEVNANWHNKLRKTLLFNQVNDGEAIFKNTPEKVVILECDTEDIEFCEKIHKNMYPSRGFYDITVKLHCSEITLLICYFISEVYYLAVDLFGSSRYSHQPEFYCNESFVPQCLPPHDNGSTEYF